MKTCILRVNFLYYSQYSHSRYSERMDRAFSSPLADWEIKTKPSAYSKPDTFAIIEEFCSLIRNFYWAFSFRTKIFNQVIKFVADIVLEEFVKEAIHHAKLNQKLSWNQWSRCIVYLLSHDSSTCRPRVHKLKMWSNVWWRGKKPIWAWCRMFWSTWLFSLVLRKQVKSFP